jgi:RND family efflux transporter MFP subunit
MNIQIISKMKLYYPFTAVVAISLLAVSCGSSSSEPQAPPKASDTVAVKTISLSKGQLSTNMVLPGELRPFQSVDLYAKVNSFVKEMFVDIGSVVHKGQLLVTLEAPELQAALSATVSDLQTREAHYKASKANYDRLLRTSKIPGTISPNDLDMAYATMGADSASLAAARSRYDEAAAMKNYLQINAPFDGVISARNVYAGAYAGPAGQGSAKPLLVLEQQAKLRLVIDAPESVTAYFRQKDTVHFTVKTLPGQQFTAFISRLAGSMNMQIRTEQLEMDVLNKDKRLLPGMYAQVSTVLTNDKKVFLVPKTAVTGNSQQIFVIRIANDKTEWVPVQKGRESMDTVEIYGDLHEGDQLVAPATDELKSGTLVQVETKVTSNK